MLTIKRNVIIPAILLIVLVQSLYAAEADLESRVQKFTLRNGIRVLLLERPLNPTVSLYIRQRAGAVDEMRGKSGTAHLLEHMLFKGTTTIGTRNYEKERSILNRIDSTVHQLDVKRQKADRADDTVIEALQERIKLLQKEHKQWMIPNEIDRIYTENGAENMNASTGQDLTTYHVSLPSNKIELWARIESDRLQYPVFREYFTERDVIMEERRQRIDTNPVGKLAEQFFATAYQAHPYGNPILGWPSDMRFLSSKDIKAFFDQASKPRHTVIAVVGDIQPQTTLAMIRRYFEKIPDKSVESPFITEEPPQSGERRVNVIFDAKPRIMIGYHKPPPPAHEDYIFDIIESILSGDRTARFYRNLVEGLKIAENAETVNGMPGERYPNLFTIFATPRHPHACLELEQAIDAELEQLVQRPVSEQELQKVKNQLKADYIRRLNSNNSLASMLSYYEALIGDYRYLMNYINVIDSITAMEIMQTAQKYLIKQNKTVATLVAKEMLPAPGADTESDHDDNEQ